jgi:molybdopterin-guanine dinucleotide biosynthesis protein
LNAVLDFPGGLPWVMSAAGLVLVLVLGGTLLWRVRHTPRRRLLATVKAISADYLHDIVIPDGLDGQIHLDLVLLTTQGILVLDIKDHRGSVFAGANMEQWTVMDGPRRISVRNPLGALHDRVHAVRQLVQNEVPVEGRAVFTSDASFVKGRPDGVVLLTELRDTFGSRNAGDERSVEAFRSRWQRIREIAAPA